MSRGRLQEQGRQAINTIDFARRCHYRNANDIHQAIRFILHSLFLHPGLLDGSHVISSIEPRSAHHQYGRTWCSRSETVLYKAGDSSHTIPCAIFERAQESTCRSLFRLLEKGSVRAFLSGGILASPGAGRSLTRQARARLKTRCASDLLLAGGEEHQVCRQPPISPRILCDTRTHSFPSLIVQSSDDRFRSSGHGGRSGGGRLGRSGRCAMVAGACMRGFLALKAVF